MFNFLSIQGNEELKRHMQSALQNDRVSHAYILEGRPGMGKKLVAKAFAKALQCESAQGRPCDQCISCKTFESNNHPDIIYVAPVKTKAIGVDDIREQVSKNMDIKPYKYRYKIFIIDHADTMTVAAQNALLKTIEEPAAYGIFLLLAVNRGYFLPTILSRCVLFTLKPLSDNAVKARLIECGHTQGEADIAGAYAGGNMGQAMRLADSEEFKAMRGRVLDMLERMHLMSNAEVFSLFALFEGYKENIQELLGIVEMWYRDVIVVKETGNANFIMQKDKKNEIIKEAASTDARILFGKLDAVWQARQRLLRNGNFQMAMEVMVLRLRGIY